MKTKLLLLLLFTFATNTFAALDTPTEDFIDNGDGTVLHKKTGLTWQRCSVGQTWSSGTCTGTASQMNWDAAMASYGNQTDCNQWRLPRIDELNTIAEHGTYNPAINSVIFPNTPSNDFWSRSVYNYESPGSYAWIVGFKYGETSNYGFKSRNNAVRIVSGGQDCSSDTSTSISDFIDNGDGTVTHRKTNLMWQRCNVGQNWNGIGCAGYESPMNYTLAINQSSSAAGYNDWRLPTLSELNTIVDYKNRGPAINSTIFPNTSNIIFWSSSIHAYASNEAWDILFGYGSNISNNISYNYGAVRLVRGTWTAPTVTTTTPLISTTIDLSTTLSASYSRVKINENLTYTATVTNNGTGTANNSLLKIYLPPRNVSIVSMPSDCAVTGKSLTCSLGNLAAGANASRAITVTYIKSGGASVGALALTDSEDTNSDNNFSRVVTAIKK